MKKRILIIEDEEYLKEYYAVSLPQHFDVRLAASGRDALRLLAFEDGIDAVVLDIKLPDMSGLEVLKEIKRVKPSTPVIMVTAFGDESIAVRSFQYGARDYLKKPFPMEHLIKKIDFYVALKKHQHVQTRKPSYYDADTESRHRMDATICLENYCKILRSIKYLDDNYMTKIRLRTLSKKACMSEGHFTRIFKRVAGTTWKGYALQLRLEKARELLKTGTNTVTEIAMLLGFADLTHFERYFKKETGITPTEYREDIKKAIFTEKKGVFCRDSKKEY